MGLRPTHGNESAFLRLIDSKQVTGDFRGSGKKKLTLVGPRRPTPDIRETCPMVSEGKVE